MDSHVNDKLDGNAAGAGEALDKGIDASATIPAVAAPVAAKDGTDGKAIEGKTTVSIKANPNPTSPPHLLPTDSQTALWSRSAAEQRGSAHSSFQALPQINKVLLVSSLALFAVAVLQIVGPPLSASFQAAIHPYTAAGKQETCLSRLQSLGQAMRMYADDQQPLPTSRLSKATASKEAE